MALVLAWGVTLVLAWWKEKAVIGQEILEKKGLGCIDGLLGESTMVHC